jgi:serine/threonine-protein kinase
MSNCLQCGKPVDVGADICGICAPKPTDAGQGPAGTDESLENPVGTSHIDENRDAPRPIGLKALEKGTMLSGRYEIVRKIGGGGMGAVYLAKDANLGGVERAVKEMIQSNLEPSQQEKAIEDFRRESRILSALDHPAIPTIYDYFFEEQLHRFYLVMKYISGGDLAARLRAAPGGKIDEKTVTDWALQICDVLEYLHLHPEAIVYRDLKPSNIMIDGKTGRIMLVDFGIARSVGQGQEKGVTAVGTMGYAPPELFSGQVEPRSDIYSLGSTMFHLLTGADPQNNPLLIFDFEKNPRPRQINPQISDQMERILMRAVEYSADNRFASASEMADELRRHLSRIDTGSLTFGVEAQPASESLSNQLVFCGFCGRQIIATDQFCAFCGSRQPIAQKGVHSHIYARPNVTAKLIVDGTTELNVPVYLLEKDEMLVGRRDPTANIFPEVDLSRFDPQTKISRRHARILKDGNTYMLEDLGSSNGTLIFDVSGNGVKLTPHSPYALASGDRIRLGDTTLQFVIS